MCLKSPKMPTPPPPPPPPPEPPRLQDPSAINARNSTVGAARNLRGSTSTILAGKTPGALGGQFLDSGKTLLGR